MLNVIYTLNIILFVSLFKFFNVQSNASSSEWWADYPETGEGEGWIGTLKWPEKEWERTACLQNDPS